MTKKVLTLADQEDIGPRHGMLMPLHLKLELLKEAGKRQAAGELGLNADPISVAELIHEAIADHLGLEIERAPKKELTEEELGADSSFLLSRFPKKLRAGIEDEKKITGKSMNQIIVDAIENKIRSVQQL